MNDAATLDAPADDVTTGIGSTGAPLGFQVLAVASIDADTASRLQQLDSTLGAERYQRVGDAQDGREAFEQRSVLYDLVNDKAKLLR